MDKLYTFTAYLFIVTCIATNCTAKYLNRTASLSTALQQMVWPSGLWGTRSWKRDIDAVGYTIHIYGRIRRSGKVKISHVNVTILAETSIANICSSTKCKQNQSVSMQPELREITSEECSMKYVCRHTCHMSEAFYRATYNVNLHCPPTQNHRTCDIARIKVTFRFKDGNQLNRTCIDPGELPYCTTSKIKKIGQDIIRCDCKGESQNCTPPTDTMTNGTTTSDTITSTTTTISSEPTIVASSGQASDTAATTKSTDTTASGTPTGTPTPGPTSGKTASDTLTGTASPASGTDTASPASGTDTASPASGTDTATPGLSSGKTTSGTTTDTGFAGTVLVGGVVGGLFGGVVITVVIVFLCRACRSRRRHTEDEDGAGTKESHTCLGLIHTTSCSGISPPGTNALTAQVPDLIKVSAVQQASSAPSVVYDVIKEGDDNQLEVDPSACDQGDYVDITDDMPGVGVYSLAQAAPGMAAQGGTPQPAEYFVLEKDDPTDGDYNKLVREGATESGTDVQSTYNRLVTEGATETTTDAQGTYNRLVREGATETGTDVQSTYNRLVREGATETGTDVQGTYNKLGSMVDDNEDNEPGGNNGTAADYFVLEKPEDTYNKLEGKRSAEEEQEPYTKLGKATPKRVRTP